MLFPEEVHPLYLTVKLYHKSPKKSRKIFVFGVEQFNIVCIFIPLNCTNFTINFPLFRLFI